MQALRARRVKKKNKGSEDISMCFLFKSCVEKMQERRARDKKEMGR